MDLIVLFIGLSCLKFSYPLLSHEDSPSATINTRTPLPSKLRRNFTKEKHSQRSPSARFQRRECIVIKTIFREVSYVWQPTTSRARTTTQKLLHLPSLSQICSSREDQQREEWTMPAMMLWLPERYGRVTTTEVSMWLSLGSTEKLLISLRSSMRTVSWSTSDQPSLRFSLKQRPCFPDQAEARMASFCVS